MYSTFFGECSSLKKRLYLRQWGFKVNTRKTKIVILSRSKVKNHYGFKIYDKIIDIQDSYSYLGIVFNYNGNFGTAR
jgi:hypothetical protein